MPSNVVRNLMRGGAVPAAAQEPALGGTMGPEPEVMAAGSEDELAALSEVEDALMTLSEVAPDWPEVSRLLQVVAGMRQKYGGEQEAPPPELESL